MNGIQVRMAFRRTLERELQNDAHYGILTDPVNCQWLLPMAITIISHKHRSSWRIPLITKSFWANAWRLKNIWQFSVKNRIPNDHNPMTLFWKPQSGYFAGVSNTRFVPQCSTQCCIGFEAGLIDLEPHGCH